MADQKISQLVSGSPMQGSDNLVIQRGASNLSLTCNDVSTAIIAAHVAATDPHAQYANTSRFNTWGDLRYVQLTGSTMTGALVLSAGGTISAGQSLNFGTDVTLSRKAANVLQPSSGDALESSAYTAGVSGWHIDDNFAEFGNLRLRGSLKSAVFEVSETAVLPGSLFVGVSAGKLASAFVVDNSVVPFTNSTNLIVTTPDTGSWLFATNDIVRIKTVLAGAVIADTWMTLTRTATLNQYTCTVNYGTVNVTYPAGVGVSDYGASGQGFFAVSADGTFGASAAWVLATHSGSPWTTITNQVYAGTNGILYAGSGNSKLDSNGLTLNNVTSWPPASYGSTVRFWNTTFNALAGQIGMKGGAEGDDLLTIDVSGSTCIQMGHSAATGLNYLDAPRGFTTGGAGYSTTLADGQMVVYRGNATYPLVAESIDVKFNLLGTLTLQTGNLTTQRAVAIYAPTYAFIGSSTITDAATFAISGAPIAGTNATITRSHALWVQAGDSTLAGGLNVGTATGAGTGDIKGSGALTIAGALGCNGATAQTAYASGGALAAYAAGTAGLDTGAHMQALFNLVVNIRAALVANGIMS